MIARKTIAVLTAALILAGCSSSKDKGATEPVVARVNGAPITVFRIKQRLHFQRIGFDNASTGTPEGGMDARMDLLSQMIEEEMYLQEAKRLKIEPSAEEVEARIKKARSEYPGDFSKALAQQDVSPEEFKDETSRKLTVEKLMADEVYSKIKVDRTAAEAYFKKHAKEFRRPARVHARQIVVATQVEAKAVETELKKGADFASLARAKSLTPDSAKGGDLGWFSKGEMPPEFNVLFGVKPGKTTGIVKSAYGFHILKVEESAKASEPTFTEAEGQVIKALSAEEGEDFYEKWQEGLKARTKVEVNFEVLKGI